MAEVTVRQLADTVGTPVDRLLRQMKEAGLPHGTDEEMVNEDQKKTLLAHLQRSHGAAEGGSKKITLKRKSTGTLKAGQGRAGRNVTVEVRRKRTYVRGGEAEGEGAAEPEAAPTSQAEIEAARIREEDSARKEAEEQARTAEAERKAEIERKAEEERLAAEEAARRAEAEQAAQQQAPASAGPVAADKAAVPADPAAAAADLQAKEQAEQKGGKRSKSKDKDRRGEGGFGGGKKGRRELSLKSERRARRKPAHRQAALKVETQGGEFKPTDFISREVEVGELNSVADLAQSMAIKASEVIKTLMGMGVMATINQTLDLDTATLLVEEMGHKIKVVSEDALEERLEASLQIEGDTQTRAPVVTVMGHVDHGKTSLLDYIRQTRVTSGEAGGITQHIGAYSVDTEGGTKVTFIDTPGHAAFTAMRARGAKVTDIVILVVAADDGVMPQTEEAIQHAKAAEVPMIVAINKCDLEGADPERVTNELAAKEVVPEDWGGDTQFVQVSAISGQGVDQLLEAIVLQSEIMELGAIESAPGQGVVIESRLDRGRGPVATVLVQNGTLKQGDIVLAGETFGRVRAMLDDAGASTKNAGPSQPVELLGLNGTPAAGDDFSVVADEKSARELAEFRADKSQERRQAVQQASKLDNMFATMAEGEKRILKLIVKADVRGSLEAIVQALADLGNDEVGVQVLGSGVGGISESDATMGVTYGAVVFGFNVRADKAAKTLLEREGIELRYYSVIYELIDDVRSVLSGMLSPEVREEIVGVAEVRDVFRSPRFGAIAGCMVTDGTVSRNKPIRVLRDNVVIYEGELESLRRFKDDVNEVRAGTECGIGVRNYNDVRPGDQIEVYDTKEVAREL